MRSAKVPGMVGRVDAWTPHPAQIEIAHRVFPPSVDDVPHARRVVGALQVDGSDGAGAVMRHGKVEDEASLEQFLVTVEPAEQLAKVDPTLAERYAAIETS